MALEIIKNINVDFYDKKYQLINAKQYDDCSRFISITCYNQGRLYDISASKHSAYVRYRKADGYGVLNFCRINYKGEILVELTEQMLSASGVCYVDLIIIDKGNAIVNVDTGEIITIDGSPIVSTMAFCIDVQEASFDNSLVESSYEYNALNELLTKAEADYQEVVQLSRSYAIGDANNIRENEDRDNSKYYCEQASNSASNAKDSENAAYTSEQNAKDNMDKAEEYKNSASQSATSASISASNASTSEANASNSESASASSASSASQSATSASISASNASTSEANASNSAISASISASNASTSEANASNSANLAQSYTVGGTGTRDGEDTDNAQYYYDLIKNIINGIETGFIPMGTITFAELATVEKATGYVYNISTDFTTDDSFREGSGKSYTAGTNVYICADGMVDCFGGASSPTATLGEVKEYLGI